MAMADINFAQLVATTYLPCTILAVVTAFVWRAIDRGALHTGLQILAALLFFIPQLLSLFLANDSVELLLYQKLTLAFWGYGISLMIAYRLWTGTGSPIRFSKAEPGSRRSKPIVVLCFGLLLSGFASWHLVGDYLLPRRTVEGYVERAEYHRGTRTGHYEVVVSGKHYAVTRDLFATMYPGEAIRAEVGVGSGTILGFDRVAPRT